MEMRTRTGMSEIELSSGEVDYILKLHNSWREDLLDGPLISFTEWILAHEIPGSEEETDDRQKKSS